MLAFVIIFPSCKNETSKSHLDFLKYPLTVHGTISFNGKDYEADIYCSGKDNIKVTFSSPEIIKDAIIEYKNGESYLYYKDISLPIADGGYSAEKGILLLRHVFSVTNDRYINADIITENGIKYCVENYESDVGEVSIYFRNDSSFPDKISASLNGQSFYFTFVNE